MQLGAKQADAGGAGLLDMRQVDRESGIDVERDRHAVLGRARLLAQREILQLPACAQPHAFDIGSLHVGRGPHVHVASRAIDNDGVARIHQAGGVLDLADGCDAERACHDRHMGGRPAFFQDDAAQPLTVIFEQRCRPHRARHDDRVLGQPVARRRVVLAKELVHQPVRQFVKVVQALAQIGVGRAQHAGAGVGLHAFDRGLGSEAGGHRFLEPMHPAAVIGEHAIGFEHIAVLAAVRDLAALEQQVEAGAHRLDRSLQPLDLLRHVVGDEVGDDHTRLVQHHMPERDAIVEGCA